MKFIGLIPAAGRATRLGSRLGGSKELLAIATADSPARPVCEYLLLQMRRAGIEQAVMVIREGKHDIPAKLGDGNAIGVRLRYIVSASTPGVPHTLDCAYDEIRDTIAVLGFPDILVYEQDCLARLTHAFGARPVDVMLGLLPIGDPDTMDAVELQGRRVRHVIPKPGPTGLTHAWAYAIWRPRFTEFLHNTLAAASAPTSTRETFVGDILEAAIAAGVTVEGAVVSERPFLDIGTPETLRAAMQGPFKSR